MDNKHIDDRRTSINTNDKDQENFLMNSEKLLQDDDHVEIEFDSSKKSTNLPKPTLYESFPTETFTKSYNTAQGSTN